MHFYRQLIHLSESNKERFPLLAFKVVPNKRDKTYFYTNRIGNTFADNTVIVTLEAVDAVLVSLYVLLGPPFTDNAVFVRLATCCIQGVREFVPNQTAQGAVVEGGRLIGVEKGWMKDS